MLRVLVSTGQYVVRRSTRIPVVVRQHPSVAMRMPCACLRECVRRSHRLGCAQGRVAGLPTVTPLQRRPFQGDAGTFAIEALGDVVGTGVAKKLLRWLLRRATAQNQYLDQI